MFFLQLRSKYREPEFNFHRKAGLLIPDRHSKRTSRRFRNNIGLPVDVALNKNDERVEEKISNLRSALPIHDIGIETMVRFSKEISSAKTVVMNGPAGF